MAIKERVIITKTCDLCKQKVEEFAGNADERHPVTYYLTKDEHYVPESIDLDVCEICMEKLVEFIDQLAPRKESKNDRPRIY